MPTACSSRGRHRTRPAVEKEQWGAGGKAPRLPLPSPAVLPSPCPSPPPPASSVPHTSPQAHLEAVPLGRHVRVVAGVELYTRAARAEHALAVPHICCVDVRCGQQVHNEGGAACEQRGGRVGRGGQDGACSARFGQRCTRARRVWVLQRASHAGRPCTPARQSLPACAGSSRRLARACNLVYPHTNL